MQNIIAHAIAARSIHIVVYQTYKKGELDKNIDKMDFKLNQADIKNIHFYKLEKLFADQPASIALLDKLLHECSSLANPVDLVKIMIGANLEKLGLETGFLADLDCIIPEKLFIESNTLTVFPLITQRTPFVKDFSGITDCYVENGYCLVLGGKNLIFNKLLDVCRKKDIERKSNDGIYSIYAEQLIRYFTQDNSDIKQLMERYRKFSNLSDPVKEELSQLQAIQYDRGSSWRAKVESEYTPLVYLPGHQPIYPAELDSLESALLGSKLDIALHLLKKLVAKNWDVNELFSWINHRQAKENVLYYFLERNYDVKGEKLTLGSNIINYLTENGLVLHKKTLSFFMHFYRSKQDKAWEAFKVYAAVFAGKYHLSYKCMLNDFNKVPNDSSRFPSDWIYSQSLNEIDEGATINLTGVGFVSDGYSPMEAMKEAENLALFSVPAENNYPFVPIETGYSRRQLFTYSTMSSAEAISNSSNRLSRQKIRKKLSQVL